MSEEITIKSRKFDTEFTFTMPTGGGYVRLWNGDTSNYEQICEGGGFRGDTIHSSPARFEADVRRWYRAHIRD